MEYATQDADPKVFEPLREPIAERAAAFRQQLVDAEPRHVTPCSSSPRGRIAGRSPAAEATRAARACTRRLREQELPHDEAFRLTLARVLVAPAFLYRVEKPGPRRRARARSPTGNWPAG